MKKYILAAAFTFNFILGNVALAEESQTACAPDSAPNPCLFTGDVIKEITSELMANKSDGGAADATKAVIQKVINQYVDIEGMSIFAVGKPNWEAADAKTQAAFKAQFAGLVEGLYASAFQSYDGQEIKVLAACNDNNFQSAKIFKVPTVIVQGERSASIKVTYRMVRSSCNEWKFYDFDVDNVRALLSFRSQFNGLMTRNTPKEGQSALAMLVELLGAHNDALSAGSS